MIVKYNSKLQDEMIILGSNKTLKIYDKNKNEIGYIINLDADDISIMAINEKEYQRFRIYAYIKNQVLYYYGYYYAIVD